MSFVYDFNDSSALALLAGQPEEHQACICTATVITEVYLWRVCKSGCGFVTRGGLVGEFEWNAGGSPLSSRLGNLQSGEASKASSAGSRAKPRPATVFGAF